MVRVHKETRFSLFKGVPHRLGQAVYAALGQADALRLARKGGQGVAVAHVGVDEARLPGLHAVVGVEALAAPPCPRASAALRTLISSEKSPFSSVAMALMRGVKLGASGSKVRVFSAETNVPPFCSAVIHGVGLVAVGDDDLVSQHAHGRVDDQGGVGQLRGVEGAGAQPFAVLHKHAVAAVDAAAHDEVGQKQPRAVRGLAGEYAAPGIGSRAHSLGDGLVSASFFLQFLGHHFRRAGQKLPFGLLHHAALQRLGRVARLASPRPFAEGCGRRRGSR